MDLSCACPLPAIKATIARSVRACFGSYSLTSGRGVWHRIAVAAGTRSGRNRNYSCGGSRVGCTGIT